MQVRNPQYNAFGTIDIEIEHPKFGWIPFTADPNDIEQLGRDLHAQALAGEFGAIAPYVAPSADDLLAVERATMVCSRFQAKAALQAAGLLSTIEAVVAAGDDFVKLAWAEAVEFKRNSPTIAALQDAAGLTDTQIDDLFRTAMTIEA